MLIDQPASAAIHDNRRPQCLASACSDPSANVFAVHVMPLQYTESKKHLLDYTEMLGVLMPSLSPSFSRGSGRGLGDVQYLQQLVTIVNC